MGTGESPPVGSAPRLTAHDPSGTSRRGRRDRHPPGLPGAPASDLAWKCGGLDAAGLRATLAPSSITLGGLLKHLALVEDDYFSRRLLGRELGSPWNSVDWNADPDWEWHSAAEDTPEQLMTLWRDAVARSRAAITEVLPTAAWITWPGGRPTPAVSHPACGGS